MKAARLLVVTGLWPTSDNRTVGTFVRDRLVGTDAVVIGPTRYDVSVSRRYGSLLLRALTTRGRFDGVEAHVLFPAGLIGLIAARLRGVPLLVYAHGSDVRETIRRTIVHRWLATRVARGAREIVANSAHTAALLRDIGATANVVHPGVDLTRFHPRPRPKVRSVLYLGGAAPHKAPEIGRRYADTVAGPGLDPIDRGSIPDLIAAHDIVIVPSREESFGLVALEAIASGRWVVAREVGGLPEIVKPGVNGTLVAEDDGFGPAIESVPDYDPWAVARTAEPFSIDIERREMASLWAQILSREATSGGE